MKQFAIIFGGVLLIGVIVYFLSQGTSIFVEQSDQDTEDTSVKTDDETSDNRSDENTLVVEVPEENEEETVIGTSVEGRDIVAYHYGEGDTEVLFVGGIHGGYAWNTSLVAYELMDYLEEPDAVPEGVRVTVIPALNPDGLYETLGGEGRFTEAAVPTSGEKLVAGRFNANEVDLNRNFDCDWKSSGVWQDKTVSGGTEAFSEPESKAMRDYVNGNQPDAVVVWYSAAGGVFTSNCHSGVLPETTEITSVYAQASGYKAYEEFDFYEITGDMVNWLASERIPAISVLLSTHSDVEWDKNKKGVAALLEYYAGE